MSFPETIILKSAMRSLRVHYIDYSCLNLPTQHLHTLHTRQTHLLYTFTLSRAGTSPNTFQIRRRDVVGTDGRPRGPTPPHPLPTRPYDTVNQPAKPVYRRGRGRCMDYDVRNPYRL